MGGMNGDMDMILESALPSPGGLSELHMNNSF